MPHVLMTLLFERVARAHGSWVQCCPHACKRVDKHPGTCTDPHGAHRAFISVERMLGLGRSGALRALPVVFQVV